jgi:pseudouridine kinase
MADIMVIGAANVDVGAVSAAPLAARDSNPGRVTTSLGGVGRNIAHNLCLLGADTAMITALGEDGFADTIRRSAAEIGLDLSASAVVPGARTGTYVFIAGPDGDMALAVNDMDILRCLTPDFLAQRLEQINRARLVVFDANLSAESICYLAEHCTVPLAADPVSAIKAEKLRPVLGRLRAIKPNRLEAAALSGEDTSTEAGVARAAEKLLDTGLEQVYISLSADGIYAADRRERVRLPCPRTRAVNATGCGDAMAAAMACALLEGEGLERTARFAMAAGAFAAEAEGTIHPGMSREAVEKII